MDERSYVSGQLIRRRGRPHPLWCSRFVLIGSSWPNHQIVASVLRSSTTLYCLSFREAACYILKDMWDSDLSAYDPDDVKDHTAKTVVLAKQCDLPYVLKRAYYELLCSHGFQETCKEPAILPYEELHLLVKTREKLHEAWVPLIFFPAKWEVCSSKSPCPSLSRRKLAWYEQVHESRIAHDWYCDPIGGLDQLRGVDWKVTAKMCDECVKNLTLEWADKKREIWDKLDGWLGLKDGSQVTPSLAIAGQVTHIIAGHRL